MVFYLLPYSSIQKPFSTVKGGKEVLIKALRDSFPQLEDLRLKLMEALPVNFEYLAPAWRRYGGRFWEELCLWAMPERVKKEVEERGILLSPLLGILRAGDPVPLYEANWNTTLGTRKLAEIWKGKVKEITGGLFRDQVVYNFMGRKELGLIDLSKASAIISFEYYKKGTKVRNPLPHRAYTFRYIAEMDVCPESLERINFLDYRVVEIQKKGQVTKVVLDSEGRYL